MKIHNYILYFLLALTVLYFAQGAFYEQGSVISQLSLFGILAISAFYFIKSFGLNIKKPLLFKIWTLLLISNILLFIFTADVSNSLHFSKLKGLLIIAMPFYPFYYLSNKNILQKNHFILLFISIVPIAIGQFYYERSLVLLERHWTDNVVNNLAYFFVFLIPFLYFFKRDKFLSLIGALILMFFIIQGAKRGALVTGLMGLLVFAIFQLKNINPKYRLRSYLFSGGALVLLVYFSLDFYQNNEYLISRLENLTESGYSGRDYIYANIFDAWYTTDNMLNTLFGFGFGASLILSKTGNWAHNDWLEGLAGLGLVGVLIYAFLFYSAFKLVFTHNWSFDKKLLLYTVLIIWLITSLFSMNYYNATYSYFQFIILGYLAGSKSKSIE